ncbi:choice-of-anchor K domain-containing protein [Microbacterium sp. BWT-B31]|uniref:choice-of-anchor K domain-containing protein n=1 Tax=Microbacterium sp. BWT-B31 TaxID=3232072 RepID=UPI0035283587
MANLSALSRAQSPVHKPKKAPGAALIGVGVLLVGMIPGAQLALDVAPAAAETITVPVDDGVRARLAFHTGWDGDTAPDPQVYDCVRYGAAPSDAAPGVIGNVHGYVGDSAAAYSDGYTEWGTAGTTVYTAHGAATADGNGTPRCSSDLDLTTQSAIGFAPASVSEIETGPLFNLGRLIHRNNPVLEPNEWYHGTLDVQLLGMDLAFEWRLHETPNQPGPPESNDIVDFLNTVGDQSFTTADGLEHTLIIDGFTDVDPDVACPETIDATVPFEQFSTFEAQSNYACLYAHVEQVRELTIVKVATAPGPQPDVVPSFDFTSTSGTLGSPWANDFTLTPTGLGIGAAASTTATFTAGESITISESDRPDDWDLVDVSCVDGLGNPLTLIRDGNVSLGRGDLSVQDPEASPITCTFTNEYHPHVVTLLGSVEIRKDVAPRPGVPAEGYTGGDERVYEVEYVCALDGFTVAQGLAPVTISAPVVIDRVPVGAECDITDEWLTPQPTDFADDDYAWDGYETSGSVSIAEDEVASLTITNLYTHPEEPVDPGTPQTPSTPGISALPSTGSAPVLPWAVGGAAVLLLGAALMVTRRARRR